MAFKRPGNEEELQRREAIGVIRASRFVRKFAHSHKPLSLSLVCEIHRQIFLEVWPDIAGKYRTENLRISHSAHLPPHHTRVVEKMKEAEVEFSKRLSEIAVAEGILFDLGEPTDDVLKAIDDVVKTAAWIHHLITYIHPFREGNGRTARLASNLILERFGLVGISIKIEKENKNKYRRALVQIDKEQDYEPLMNLIYEGLLERYEGVAVKYYPTRKK